jgi:hypothetical protein
MLVLDALEDAAGAGRPVVVASHDPHVLERATRAIPIGL